jgi:hypothetical protein
MNHRLAKPLVQPMREILDIAERNRRGCYVFVAVLFLVLAIIGYLAGQTADTATSDEALSEPGGSPIRR